MTKNVISPHISGTGVAEREGRRHSGSEFSGVDAFRDKINITFWGVEIIGFSILERQ